MERCPPRKISSCAVSSYGLSFHNDVFEREAPRRADPEDMKAKDKAPGYVTWKAEAAKLLSQHDISAAAIPEKEWRRLFVTQQATPVEAAEAAKVHEDNFIRRPTWAPKRRRATSFPSRSSAPTGKTISSPSPSPSPSICRSRAARSVPRWGCTRRT